VERGGRVIGVEPEVALHGVGCRERLDVDAARAEPLERFRVGPEAAVRARADDQPLRQLVEDVGEVVEHEAVPVPAPPVADDPAGQDDDVAGLLAPVDDDAAEALPLDPRHRSQPALASRRRSATLRASSRSPSSRA